MLCQLPNGAPLRRILLLAATAILPASPAAADTVEREGLEISGSLRVRGDAVEGQFRPGKAEDDAILMLRSTILARYTDGPVQVVGELYDARVYGQSEATPIGTGEVNALEPLQAYVALNIAQMLGANFDGSLKAGRLTMDIGSGRLISRSGDSNFPTSYLGTTFDLTTPGDSRLQLFWTMPITRLPKSAEALQDNEVELDRATSDVQFFGGHYSRPVFGGAEAEIYAYRLIEEDAPGYATRNRELFTYGARLSRAPAAGAFDFDLEFARQDGEINASSAPASQAHDVDAYFLHAEIGRKWAGGWRPRVSAHLDIASGDGDQSEYGRFDPLFGGRRGEFGPTAIYGPLKRSNLISPGVRFEAKPSDRFDLMTMYRALWLDKASDSFAATGVVDPAGSSGTWAGSQVELRLRYSFVPGRLQLEGGGAYLAKSRFLREAPNAPATGDTRYGYLSLLTTF